MSGVKGIIDHKWGRVPRFKMSEMQVGISKFEAEEREKARRKKYIEKLNKKPEDYSREDYGQHLHSFLQNLVFEKKMTDDTIIYQEIIKKYPGITKYFTEGKILIRIADMKKKAEKEAEKNKKNEQTEEIR